MVKKPQQSLQASQQAWRTKGRTVLPLGAFAGQMNQASQAVAIGPRAAQHNQGAGALAIGFMAGTKEDDTSYGQPANTIIINASGLPLAPEVADPSAGGCYVAPVRSVAASDMDPATHLALYWDSETKEVFAVDLFL
jgi:hypothetical protein